MYMYNNSMAMTNTSFDMDTDSGPVDRMAAAGQKEEEEEQGSAVTINMYMYDNEMTMDNTMFTMRVKP